MKKQKNILGGLLLMFCLLLSACNGQENIETAVDAVTDNQVLEAAVEGKEGSTSSSSYEVPYEYQQELQVIDDNYRNYYEIFVYSFYDSDGDGIGDLNGVTQKLDYIQDMGFNGIWLIPVFQSTTYHKYDVVDYYAIDAEYGTLEDFQKLVEECHKRGIRVIIDFVINHSSSQHEWFLQAIQYLQQLESGEEPDLEACKYVDYYHFTKEKSNDTYYQVGKSDWYYEGGFWSEMPDLNLQSEAVRKEIEDISKYWIEKGVDGFRMDAAMHFEENNTAQNTEILQWLYQYCVSLHEDFYMVSEVWANLKTITDYYASETPSMFNFDLADKEGKLIKAARGTYPAENFVNAMLTYQEDFTEVYKDYIDAPFIANHDMGRESNALRNDEDDIKMAAGLLMTLNGSPFVYYGEEIGMASSGIKDENKRLAMIWSMADNAGMTVGPKDADQGIESAFEGVEEQSLKSDSILNYYKRALRLRNENPEIARGTIEVIEDLCEGHQAVICKTYQDSSILIAYNTSDEVIEINLPSTMQNIGIRGYLTLHGEEVVLQQEKLIMPAQSICILK